MSEQGAEREYDKILGEVIEAVERDFPSSLTVNQVVSYNVARIRNEKGLTQAQAIGALEPYLGRWSKQRYSSVERVYSGGVKRDFSVNEIVAFAGAFGVPATEFFTRPPRAYDIYTTADLTGRRIPVERWPETVGGPSMPAKATAARLRQLADELERL